MNSQDLLRIEVSRVLESRRKERWRYGRMKFANDIGYGGNNLSGFLNGKLSVGEKTATKYFKDIIPLKKWDEILSRYEEEKTASQNIENINTFSIKKSKAILNRDQYKYHSDPLLVSILHLLELDKFRSSLEWMGQKLYASPRKVKSALDALIRLNLVEKSNGRFIRRNCQVVTTDGIDGTRNDALLEFRRDLYSRFENTRKLPRNEWDECTWTFAFDPKDVPELKVMIRSFLKKVERKQLRSKNKRVYTFFTGLMPLSR